MIRRPPKLTLFPYKRLFRSRCRPVGGSPLDVHALFAQRDLFVDRRLLDAGLDADTAALDLALADAQLFFDDRDGRLRSLLHLRSEEHTSELQSRQYLVCRLL